jgi:Phosphotransferase enzyme family
VPPGVFVTHDVTFESEGESGGVAVKRFRSQTHGDEAQREWQALRLLKRYAPGLAADPIRADLTAEPPVVVMSRLPGEPLGTEPATKTQLDAIVAAIERLHQAVPPRVLGRLKPASADPAFVRDQALKMAARQRAEALDPPVRQAYHAALAWLGRPEPTGTGPDIAKPVFAHRDGNLANHLWDGHQVRLVDFEHSGRGERAGELADFVEHLSVWAGARIEASAFLGRFDLSAPERQRIRLLRPLFAAYWLMRLLPGGSSHARNPPGTLDRQASRLLDLTG